MEQVEVDQVPRQAFLKELKSVSSKQGEICKAPKSAHDFQVVSLAKDEQGLQLEPLSPKVFRFENIKLHLFNQLGDCKGENGSLHSLI